MQKLMLQAIISDQKALKWESSAVDDNLPNLIYFCMKEYKSKSNLPIYWNHPMQSCWHYIQNQMNFAGLIQGEVNMDALFQQIK